jgi:teichuronic acid biosynthesis glycosyltransferase TuaH
MKVLYLMHVNWHWIRQRPQVLADLLAQSHEVHVLHYAMFHRNHRAGEAPPPPGSRVLRRLPGRIKRSLGLFESLDAVWIARQVAAEVHRFQPDLLWVTHPDFADAATAALAAGVPRVVYDCMDDHLAFQTQTTPQMHQAESRLAQAEARLVQAATLTLFSSTTLALRVSRRSEPRQALVVNNGVDESLCRRLSAPVVPDAGAVRRLGYFGTVSHWFDWPLVLAALQALPDHELLLAGPVETALPQHPRVRHVGVLAHAQLAAFAAGCDVLLMPFHLTPLIQAVDPVKLYEYIAFNRQALAPRYAESERFSPHVALYGSASEAIALLQAWAAGTGAAQPGREAAQAFLQANTWQQRAAQISAALG